MILRQRKASVRFLFKYTRPSSWHGRKDECRNAVTHLMNSLSEISPSISRSNSSIIADLHNHRVSFAPSLEGRGRTHSSSSVKFSPSSRATFFRFRKEILPEFSSSKSLNARRISSNGSRARTSCSAMEWGGFDASRRVGGRRKGWRGRSRRRNSGQLVVLRYFGERSRAEEDVQTAMNPSSPIAVAPLIPSS